MSQKSIQTKSLEFPFYFSTLPFTNFQRKSFRLNSSFFQFRYKNNALFQMNIPKLDFNNLHGEKNPKTRDFNILNGQYTSRSQGTTVSWGTHAGSNYHNQCKQVYYKPKEVTTVEPVKIVKNKGQTAGDYVLAKQVCKNSETSGEKRKLESNQKTHESEYINPPKLDLEQIKLDCESKTNPEIIKITIQPKPLQLIDHVADRHLQYLKTIKLDENFMNRLTSRLTARGDMESCERQRVIRDALDQILADQLSTGVLSSSKCTSVTSGANGFVPGARMPSKPIAKGASRRLHDSNVNPSGMVGESALRDKIVFLGRFISPQSMVLKQLIGVHFNYKTCYELR